MRVTVEETRSGTDGRVTNVSFYPGSFAEMDRETGVLRIFFAENGDRTVTIPAGEWLTYNVSKVD